MYLKRIELSGFKSFCDDTALEFSPGISVVVGPNGCGKSNIVDAVCWAMGEQGLRPLRAKNPEDLIFAGSRDLPPDPTAEVSLIFDNQDGSAPPEYNQFSEIAITRRIHRTGESEFLVNRSRCRLKDITEFFLGTGLGKQAYSVIEQGEIDRIIQAKPEEIRGLIEEAAGISKYRFRRDEALKKMHATRENLLRIRDILNELKTQLNSLSRQAKKAERYHLYKNELKETEMEIYCHRGIELKDRMTKLELDLKALTDELEQARVNYSKLEIELEDKRNNLELLDGELRAEQERKYRLKSKLEQLDSEAALRSGQEQTEKAGIERRKIEAANLETQIQAIAGELAKKTKQKEEMEFELSSLSADLESKSKEVEAGLGKLSERKNALDKLSAAVRQNEQEFARLGEKERSVVWQQARIEEEQERTQGLLIELEPLILGERQRSFNFNQNLHQLRKSLSELEQRFVGDQAALEKLKGLIAEKTGRSDEIKNQFQAVSAKVESLKEMIEKLEGFERGVKFILDKKRSQPGQNGVYGLVAEMVETAPEYEAAVEAVLGERIQSVIVESPSQGLEAVNCLVSESAGRGTFIPKTPRSIPPIEIPEHIRTRGAKPLLDLVKVREGFEPVVKYLLGPSVLVSDLNQAVELWQSNGFQGAFVTKDGSILDPHGALSGGSKDQAGFLSKKRELKELEMEKSELKTKLDQIEQELLLLQGQLAAGEKDIESLRGRIHDLKLETLTQEKDLKTATDELNQKNDSQQKLKIKAEELASQLGETKQGQAEIEKRKTALQAEMENWKNDHEALAAQIDAGQAEQKKLEDDRSTIRAELAGLREKSLAVEEARLNLQKSTEDQAERRTQLLAELEQAAKTVLEIKDRLAQVQIERQETVTGIDEQAKTQSDLEAQRALLVENLARGQADLKEINSLVRVKDEEISRCSLDLEKEKLGLDNLRQLVSEIYQENIETVIENYKPRVSVSEFSAQAKEERAEELRRLIHRMGEVNPTALEEYKEVETRFSFLSNQEADLVLALDKLEQTITKINSEYRHQFKETFENVAKIFHDLFPQLFGGGKATLMLSDENNLLETGVEIIAQPPGKKLQSLSLLSGGEKSLAALSLVFSLYLNRPSPFCLLDEVDAALDEVNIDRFNHLLKSLAQKSQILIVTHNKRTMELADLLYGVTMEKPGVSRVVSVRLEEIKDNNSTSAR